MITLQQANQILELVRKLREADEVCYSLDIAGEPRAKFEAGEAKADALFNLLEFIGSLTIVDNDD